MNVDTKQNTNTALLVIDVQESFRHRPYFTAEQLPAFFDRLQYLVDGFAAHGLPVIRIFHTEDQGDFSLASGHVVTMPELNINPDVTIHKQVHSAFGGTGLQQWLTQRGITRLVITGIRTEQCCETTTRYASDSGYKVDYVTEATLTFPMTQANGRVFSADEIKEKTELVLAGRFANIVSAEQALARAISQ